MVTAENKWVDIDIVANFNRMRRFNLEDVYKAMEKSEFMELNEDKTKMRRKNALAAVKEGNKIVDHSLDRSLYAVWKPTSFLRIVAYFPLPSLLFIVMGEFTDYLFFCQMIIRKDLALRRHRRNLTLRSCLSQLG